MRAGKLRHRLQIQEGPATSYTRGTAGGVVPVYTTVARRWGEIVPTGGGESVEAQQVTASASFTIRIRFHEGLTTAHRFLFGSRAFDINAIINTDERNKEQVCACTERPSGS